MCKQCREITYTSVYPISDLWAFNNIENKHTLYPGEDCIKKFSASLREHARNVNKFEKKKMLPLRKKRAKITPGSDITGHLRKNILKNAL